MLSQATGESVEGLGQGVQEGGIQSESKQSIHCLEDGRDCWWMVIGQELSLISCESGNQFFS